VTWGLDAADAEDQAGTALIAGLAMQQTFDPSLGIGVGGRLGSRRTGARAETWCPQLCHRAIAGRFDAAIDCGLGVA
jgi:hypothetical protein